METTKRTINLYWPLRLTAHLVLRPKRFWLDWVCCLVDYNRFRRSCDGLLAFLRSVPPQAATANNRGLLIVAGRKMNTQWNQLWAVLGGIYRARGHAVHVLTTKSEPIQNLYYRLFGIRPIFLEQLGIDEAVVPGAITVQIESLKTFSDFKAYEFRGMPLGKMALSTYSRQRASGIMDLEQAEARKEVISWLVRMHKILTVSERLYETHNIEMLFFTELFMEEYGAFYYAALKKKLNIVRFAGTVRDEAVVIQHMTEESDRTHFSSINRMSWQRILSEIDLATAEKQVHQNFMDRYGDRWAMSKRNQPNTKIAPLQDARASLGIPDGRKIAVIYSHILYDTLFFNGEDLFENYASWLVETVRAASRNPRLQWYVKIHPSNLWRGELEQYHAGKYEEVRLIEEHIGTLPDHVRLIFPDTPFSPYTWLGLADYGVTVRGTSGIELAAMGKPVITAGSGRYEEIGFSVNSSSIPEYLELLSRLETVAPPSDEQKRLGKLFAYATFCMKPFTLDFLKPRPRAGKAIIFGTDDLIFVGNFPERMTQLPESLAKFVDWSFEKDEVDFLSGWPSIARERAA